MSIITDTAKTARHFGDALSEAAVASIKQDQELTGRAFEVWIGVIGSGLGATSASELADSVSESVTAGFDLAKQALEGRREIAEKLVAAVQAGKSLTQS
jgi:hypothetical protein